MGGTSAQFTSTSAASNLGPSARPASELCFCAEGLCAWRDPASLVLQRSTEEEEEGRRTAIGRLQGT